MPLMGTSPSAEKHAQHGGERGSIRGCLDTCTVILFTYSPESQLRCLHPDVVELRCEVVLSLAAGSGELFSLKP